MNSDLSCLGRFDCYFGVRQDSTMSFHPSQKWQPAVQLCNSSLSVSRSELTDNRSNLTVMSILKSFIPYTKTTGNNCIKAVYLPYFNHHKSWAVAFLCQKHSTHIMLKTNTPELEDSEVASFSLSHDYHCHNPCPVQPQVWSNCPHEIKTQEIKRNIVFIGQFKMCTFSVQSSFWSYRQTCIIYIW